MDVAQAAERVVERTHPRAIVALLAGSRARGEATATSDMDLVLIFPGSGRSFRETLREQDQLVEVFAYTPDELRRWWDIDAATGTCALVHMCATGLLLRGGEQGEALQEQARALLAAGPLPMPEPELAATRYRVTASLDDLRDATDAGERQTLAAILLLGLAELALIARREWRGQGKWLIRRLRAADPDLAERLVQITHGDTALVLTDPQNDFLSPQGVTWDLVGKSVEQNGTVAHIEQLLTAAKLAGRPVFVSPDNYFPHDHKWEFGGTLEQKMHEIGMFDRPGPLEMQGFPGSGADWLEQYRPYLEDGQTVVCSPHKVYGPEQNDLMLRS